MEFETVVGLEIHAQLLTKTKIFCSCTSQFGGEPNTHGCPVCLGLPGSLPVLNRTAVDMAIRMGLAVGCTIAPRSVFARKNYFYPDLPKGYQISQYDMPLCEHGALDITVDGAEKRVGITRIHLEEDAGKLVHDQGAESLFDVNRCGTPLIEIVSEPDMRSPAEAYAYCTTIKRMLEYLGICDCNMEEGSLRCDANVSLRPRGETKLGTKVELKNMNTFRGVEKALDYEVRRQAEVLSSGGTIHQQTYLWDAAAGCTAPMRDKEDAHDYRYFPDPDLVPLVVEEQTVQRIRKELPELPQARRRRLIKDHALTPNAADVLTDSRIVADYFEAAARHCADATLVANWVMGEVLRLAKDKKVEVSGLKTTPSRLAQLLTKVKDGVISASAAKKVLDIMEAEGREPGDIIKAQGLEQVSDVSALQKAVDEVLAGSPKEIERYKAGDMKLMAFFVGRVMKSTRGKGNPAEINRILNERLSA
jgi:aspartyl-tRNA(Asn)/glutamyl-tRNA(Gln) amidotransferase subunit B